MERPQTGSPPYGLLANQTSRELVGRELFSSISEAAEVKRLTTQLTTPGLTRNPATGPVTVPTLPGETAAQQL